MNYTLKDLLDVPRLRELLDMVDEIHSMPSAILDIEGNILTATGWQDICTKFHRINPATAKKCQESDTRIQAELDNHAPQTIYRCPMGLVDAASAIVIDGEHLGNVYTGQLFMDPPAEEDFIKQAQQYGFDEQEYLAAMRQVPFITEERLRKNLSFIHSLTQLLAKQGMQHKRQLEAEKALQEREERYRSLFAGAGEGIFILAPDGRLVEVNEAFARMHGYTLQEMQQMKLADLDTPETSALVPERMHRLLAGESLTFEVEHCHKDGHVFPLEVSANLISFGGKSYFQCFHRDISERKRSEENLLLREQALASSEQFLKTIIDTEPECIKMLDRDGNLLLMNPAGLAMIEADSFELVKGQCVFSLVTEPYREDFIALTRQAFQGLPGTLEFEAIGLKGRQVWLETHAVPFHNEQGEITALLGVTRDVTEKKRLAAERVALEQQLQQTQRLESLGVLAGGIAHDFNNLLAVIMGNCALAKLKPAQAGEKIPPIETAAKRAAELCQQMLAYAGKASSMKTPTRLDDLVEEMVRMARSTIPQNVKISSDLKADIPLVSVDASQLRQVVMNLIINAAEAIGEAQGEVCVSLEKAAIGGGRQEIDHLGAPIRPGGYVCLQVIDNGCGMDAETQQRIFEPFYTTKFAGRGLGMAAVLGIIKGHKGALQLSSQPGQGSTFRVFLPLQTAPLPAAEPRSTRLSEPWHGRGTILLVEDEEQVMALAEAMLEELGFQVVKAMNGQEALDLYQQKASDLTLVITDIGMPVMDGYALCDELKKLQAKVPIIISSGFGDTTVTSRINPQDIAGLVNKPYDLDQLRNVLKRVVEGNDRG